MARHASIWMLLLAATTVPLGCSTTQRGSNVPSVPPLSPPFRGVDAAPFAPVRPAFGPNTYGKTEDGGDDVILVGNVQADNGASGGTGGLAQVPTPEDKPTLLPIPSGSNDKTGQTPPLVVDGPIMVDAAPVASQVVEVRRYGVMHRWGKPKHESVKRAGHHAPKRNPPADLATNNTQFPRELRMKSHPLYMVEPPDILYIEALQLLEGRPVVGERLVRQDGTVSLGYYGQVHVAGLTLAETEEKIRKRLAEYTNDPVVYVDIASFNSKVYYVLGQVQQTGRLPITGKETVLDGLTLAGGPTNFANLKKIHLVRPSPGGGCDQTLTVDYEGIIHRGDTRTNYQLLPGDRIVVPGTRGYDVSVAFDNYLTPVERLANLFALIRFASD